MESLKSRVASVDILRGIVMVVMALDHARDYFTNYPYDPLDLTHASVPMFLTRWITHYCAPVFVFFAGTSAFISISKGKSKVQAAKQLLTRGLWLVLLELTILRFGWIFNMDYSTIFVQVIWAIGWSMVCLAGLIFLPLRMILGVGLLLIFGHNLLDSINGTPLGQQAWWFVVHRQNDIVYNGGMHFFIVYPLVPWIGVMATGYCFGTLLFRPAADRDKAFYTIGISAIVLFLILRGINVYGDASHWVAQDAGWKTVLSFLDCTKYPPSLLYLLMTLGPAIAILPLLEKASKPFANFFTVYGRVPLFYYILHVYLLHGLQLLVGVMVGFPAERFTSNQSFFIRDNWGFSLPMVYAVWITAVLLLYFPCRWFMRVKMNNKKWWLSYL